MKIGDFKVADLHAEPASLGALGHRRAGLCGARDEQSSRGDHHVAEGVRHGSSSHGGGTYPSEWIAATATTIEGAGRWWRMFGPWMRSSFGSSVMRSSTGSPTTARPSQRAR